MTEKKRPQWHSSSYRGSWDWKKNRQVVIHKKPLRCPYCGNVMGFATPVFYESHTSDWYWFCTECNLRLPNAAEFKSEKLEEIRDGYRKRLEKSMGEAKDKFKRVKKIYNAYGRYFTPEEKRDRLIETIEKHKVNKDAVF